MVKSSYSTPSLGNKNQPKENEMATTLLSRIQNDVTMTWEKASQELADVFSKPALMAENLEILPKIYEFLKEQPKLCELLFEELIKRHNAVASMSDAVKLDTHKLKIKYH